MEDKILIIRWHPWRRRVVAVILMIIFYVLATTMIESVVTDPQTDLLHERCSPIIVNVQQEFFSNFNTTFADLRRQLSESNVYFATAYQTDVFALFQCRNYLSNADCMTCFDSALLRMRGNCPTNNGGDVIYQGCFLRYNAHNFFEESAIQTNGGICSNRTLSNATAFDAAVEGLLTDLEVATPKTKGFFASVKREEYGGGGTVYAVAQCIETLSSSVCKNCLSVAYGNIQRCPPQTGGSSIDFRCFMRYSNTSFFADNQTTNIIPYLDGGGSSMKIVISASVAGSLGLLLLILVLLLWCWLSRKPETKTVLGDILGVTKLQGPVIYNYKDLKSATKNFAEEYKVGGGAFGDVYKGIIKNGDIVAVKKLAIATSRARAEFESEVRLVSNAHHRNIIRLLGCSGKGPELLLVYEYMSNGSLDKFLYGEKRGTLSWKQRVDIIFGIARGLVYLHEQFHVHIIHRDIKSSNILLDDDFQPKIADFGLARLLPEDQNHCSTKFAGTLGYAAPEYVIHGHLSDKVDTYSFGVVALEIISGHRCNSVNTQPITESLVEHAWKLYENGMLLKLVDESIDSNEYNAENAKKLIEIAMRCTLSPVSSRPTMSEVLVSLTNGRSVEHRSPGN